MIQAQELTRTYNGFTAVDQVSFSIESGEIVGLLGHNGAGKTTIMKMLTGYLEPTSGRITIDGLDPLSDPLPVRARIGYLPENCPVYPEMTVMEYLDFTAALHGIDARQRPKRIRDAVSRTGLKEKALQPISTLSRGYRQRTGVAQAIVHEPKILILDEPTNGLDPTQIVHMRELIRELAQEATVIISTHILQEVQAICSRVMIMRGGRKVLDRKLKELGATDRLLITTDADPDSLRNLLASTLPETARQELETLSTNRYRLRIPNGAEPQQIAANVAELLTKNGHSLFELQLERQSLEQIFGEITGGSTEAET